MGSQGGKSEVIRFAPCCFRQDTCRWSHSWYSLCFQQDSWNTWDCHDHAL